MSRKQKVFLKDAKERVFNKHGNNIEILEYTYISAHAKFKCNVCGNIWESEARSMCRGHGCPRCSEKATIKKLTFNIEYVKSFIANAGCELISKEYVNSKTPIRIKFQCGCISEMGFRRFKIGQRCKCMREKQNKIRREQKTRKKTLDTLNKIGFEFISFENNWATHATKVTYVCNREHLETKSVASILRKKRCIACSKIKYDLNNKGKNANGWNGGTSNLRQYAHTKLYLWRKASIKNSDGVCVISGDKFDRTHHLYSLSAIVKEAISNLGLETKDTIGEYKEEDLELFAKEILRLHDVYGPGVCLRKDIHKKFHDMFDYRGNTIPAQFKEFHHLILSGEIKIPNLNIEKQKELQNV